MSPIIHRIGKGKKRCQVLCGSLFHIARLYFNKGDMEKGLSYLKQGMELAAGNRYFMFWDIHIPTIVEIGLRSIRYGLCTTFALELLGKFYDEHTVMYLCEKSKSMDGSRLSAFIDDFVFTFKKDKPHRLYCVRASLLGKTEISVNGIKIPDDEWKTKKVKGLLEYLLLNSGHTVSKEALAELLWPGSDSKSAIASQRTALYYLRKVLSKYNAEVTGSSAFIYETLDGLQVRRNELLELDIHKFLQLHDELSGLSVNTGEEGTKRENILVGMISIYKGDLLEGGDYGDLVIQERERLKSIFIDGCHELSLIYLKQKEFRKGEEILTRALAADPYNESICLELLRLYMLQGRKSKAVKLYYSFKKRLEQDLDIKVDSSLTLIIRGTNV